MVTARRTTATPCPLLTTWKPSGCATPIQGGCPQAQFIDPTTNPANPGFYSTNLIRAMTGYAGIGNVIDFTNSYGNNYNSLQMQLNRRVGRSSGASTTPSPAPSFSTMTANGAVAVCQRRADEERRQPPPRRQLQLLLRYPRRKQVWSNGFTKAVLDGWHLNGNGSIFAGTPYTVGCSATGQPSQYWTGTPTAYLPFRCQMGNSLFLPAGQLPSATANPNLQVPSERRQLHLTAGELVSVSAIRRRPCSTVRGCGIWTCPWRR